MSAYVIIPLAWCPRCCYAMGVAVGKIIHRSEKSVFVELDLSTCLDCASDPDPPDYGETIVVPLDQVEALRWVL